MPDNQESLKELADALDKLKGLDISDVSDEISKKLVGALDSLSSTIKSVKEAAKTTTEKLGGLVGNLSSLGVPLAKSLGSGIESGKKLGATFKTLGTMGIPGMTKAASALAGPAGIAAGAVIGIGKALIKLSVEMGQARMKLVELSGAVGGIGDITAAQTAMAFTYFAASQAIRAYSTGLEDVNQVVIELINSGIKPTAAYILVFSKGMLDMKYGLGMSTKAVGESIRYLRQELKIDKALITHTKSMIVGYEKLNMSMSQYMRNVLNLSKDFIHTGVNINTLSDSLQNLSKGGTSRARRKTKEMNGAPRKAGWGQRAWLAGQMGMGATPGSAAMLAYGEKDLSGKPIAEDMGSAVIKAVQKQMGLGDVEGLETGKQKWESAALIAMFAKKEFGISEVTIYEKLGLPIKQQTNHVKATAEGVKELNAIETESLKTLKEAKSGWQEFKDWFKSGQTAVTGVVELNRHVGGMIPKYHNGLAPDERSTILQVGEGVLNNYNGVKAAGGPAGIERMNKGLPPVTGQGGGGSYNINVNIPALRPYIERALNQALTENPNIVAMG